MWNVEVKCLTRKHVGVFALGNWLSSFYGPVRCMYIYRSQRWIRRITNIYLLRRQVWRWPIPHWAGICNDADLSPKESNNCNLGALQKFCLPISCNWPGIVEHHPQCRTPNACQWPGPPKAAEALRKGMREERPAQRNDRSGTVASMRFRPKNVDLCNMGVDTRANFGIACI